MQKKGLEGVAMLIAMLLIASAVYAENDTGPLTYNVSNVSGSSSINDSAIILSDNLTLPPSEPAVSETQNLSYNTSPHFEFPAYVGSASISHNKISIVKKQQLNISATREWEILQQEADGKLKLETSPSGGPTRIIGTKIRAGKEVAYAKVGISKENAESFIRSNQNLLGLEYSDLKISNEYESGPFKTYSFQQYYMDIPVFEGGAGITLEKEDYVILFGSNYHQGIDLDTVPSISSEDAFEAVVSDLGITNKSDAVIRNITLIIFPVDEEDQTRYYLSWKVDIILPKMPGAWTYLVDAHSGDLISRINLLKDYPDSITVHGTASSHIYPEHVYDPLQQKPLANAYVYFYDSDPSDSDDLLGSSPYTTDSSGYYDSGWMSTMTDPGPSQGQPYITSYLKGPYLEVEDYDGEPESYYFDLTSDPSDSITHDFNMGYGEQQNVFYHANLMHDYFRQAPFNFRGMDYRMIATVGYGTNYCNAFYDGRDIAFGDGIPSRGCGNLALDSDIIYHEYMHGVTDRIIYLPYSGQSGAIDEALSDYYGCSFNGNPIQGEGTFSGGARRLDNSMKYPDDWEGEVHHDSMIISGAFWEVRSALGRDYTDLLVFRALKMSPHAYTFTAFLENMLLADDDDGDLSDGTPNMNVICDAFNSHGIDSDYCVVVSCSTSWISYPYDAEVGNQQTYRWSNSCSSSSTMLRYCSPDFSGCSYSNHEYSTSSKQGSKGTFSESIVFDEPGSWKIFAQASSDPGTAYSSIITTVVTLPKTDLDGDGYDDSSDCNDSDASIHPGATETCNAKDDDCDGKVDESLPDIFDGSDTGVCQTGIRSCQGGEWVIVQERIDPVEEICENGLDDDCDGKVDECLSLIINAPSSGVKDTRRIYINLTTNGIVDRITYTDSPLDDHLTEDHAARSSERMLCARCDGYGYDSAKMKVFSEGWHNITFKAYVGGETFSNNVMIFIDSISPRIFSTLPKKGGYTNGSFTVIFREENPVKFTLAYGPVNDEESYDSYSETYQKQDFTFFTNITRLDGMKMHYWMRVTDVAGNLGTSRDNIVYVDVTKPNITRLDYEIIRRSASFDIDISEKVTLEYLDGSRWNMMCRNCDSYSRRKTFSRGDHNVTIKATDKAGNTDIKEISFRVD